MARRNARSVLLALVAGSLLIPGLPATGYVPSSDPGTFAMLADGRAVFSAEDGIHGDEFWVTDGTYAGTQLLVDTLPGLESLSPSRATVVGDSLYFSGTAAATGRELWRLDLTTAEITLVMDIDPGQDGSSPNYLTALGDTLYFVAATADEGREIWRSQGTPATTERVTQIEVGNTSSRPADLTVLGDHLIVYAEFLTGGDREVAVIDTTDDSHVRIEVNGAASGLQSGFAVLGGHAYFAANDGVNGSEPWRTDGTPAGTAMVDDVNPGAPSSFPSMLGVHDGLVYIAADDGAVGRELHTTDGTGVDLLKDINAGAPNGSPGVITTVGDTAYFRATTAAEGTELWHTDGTPAGTGLVADIHPGADSSFPSEMFAMPDGTLFFEARDAAGSNPWVSDGTAAGTTRLGDLAPGPGDAFVDDPFVLDGQVLFALGRFELDGEELWATDGTPDGTRRVRDINIGTIYDGLFGAPVVTPDGTAYFPRWTPEDGEEPWVSDGTPGGARQIADLVDGPEGSEPVFHGTVGERALFTASTPETGTEPWVTDGTEAGTQMLADMWAGENGSSPYDFVQLGDQWIFVAEDPAVGEELFITDGTPGGTGLLKDINPGGDSDIRWMVSDGTHAWFSADDGVNGDELWWSDGTPGGTVLVKDIRAGALGSTPSSIEPFGAGVLLEAFDNLTGQELWFSDGTGAGTVQVKDINPAGNSRPRDITSLGTHALFTAYTDGEGDELWITDGTGAGTTLTGDINPGPASSAPDHLTALDDGVLVFDAYEPAGGREPYQVTTAGGPPTRLLDLSPGADSTYVHEIVPGFGGALLSAATPAEGHELFFTDGTSEGTGLLLELRDGPASGSPAHLTGGSLWFSAWSDLTRARELYRMEDAGSPAIRVSGPAPSVERFDGVDRAETAVKVSQATHPNGANTVVLARLDTYPDSLAGGPLAHLLGAPILLTRTGELTEVTRDEIVRLGAREVVVLGGGAAVSDEVVQAVLDETDVTEQRRIAGDDRFATAALIADELPDQDLAYVTEGFHQDPARGWPDAVSVSGFAAAEGRPILLVTQARLPDATADALQGRSEAILIGGAAAISEDVEDAIDGITGSTSRLAGDDRYRTSEAVAQAAVTEGANDRIVHLATGANFPDALVAGPAVAWTNGVLLLTHPTDPSRSPTTSEWLDDRAGILEVVRILGGEGAVGPAIADHAAAAVAG